MFFYFILKAHFILKLYKFLSCRKNGLIRKARLASKFVMTQPGLQTTAIHIVPYISQSKSNQTMQFGQSAEYNKRNFFLQKLCEK